MVINTFCDLTFGELLVKEIKKRSLNLLLLNSQLLPEK